MKCGDQSFEVDVAEFAIQNGNVLMQNQEVGKIDQQIFTVNVDGETWSFARQNAELIMMIVARDEEGNLVQLQAQLR
ncbi:MAG: hypothetical protein HRT44_10920 [Bdellovibrionales bacterium]|nr:hypothetical protein [Bdellovibrionales bacterium]NQZ19752.1 hypothetical protein [Bdellovibrionales bacterium]